MKKRSKETPRMLPYVMQAVTDLKDINGSATRRILDQVHTAINLLNVKPKPRNVVMQVKRALRHAVDNGILRHRAGKYRLSIDSKAAIKDNGLKMRSRRMRTTKHQRRHRKSRRSSRRRHRRRRRIVEFRYSPSSVTSGCSERSYASTTTDSYESMKKSRSRRRRRRSLAKKTIRIKRSATRKKDNRRKRKVRQPTPMPREVKGEDIDETAPTNTEMENIENIYTNSNENNEQGDGDPYAKTEEPKMPISPECDNPDCLCNLKQEPYEDSNYDNCGKSFSM